MGKSSQELREARKREEQYQELLTLDRPTETLGRVVFWVEIPLGSMPEKHRKTPSSRLAILCLGATCENGDWGRLMMFIVV